MKRTIALPLLAMAFAVAENSALLTLTEKAGGQTVTLPLTTGLLGEWIDARLER